MGRKMIQNEKQWTPTDLLVSSLILESLLVRVDAQSALDGTVNVLDTLVRIPPPVVARMQQTLAAEGHRLVYGYGRRGVRDDAIDRLLEVLSRGG